MMVLREMRMRAAIVMVGVLVVLGCAAPSAGAAALQPVGQFQDPVFVTSDPNDAGRLFVVERPGAIRMISGGATRTFLDISPAVEATGGEQGLLSMAFAPDFAQSGRFYV